MMVMVIVVVHVHVHVVSVVVDQYPVPPGHRICSVAATDPCKIALHHHKVGVVSLPVAYHDETVQNYPSNHTACHDIDVGKEL